jgi:hypothetical protein
MPGGASASLMASLTPTERTFVLKQRIINVIHKLAIMIMWAGWNQSYIDLCGGDACVLRVPIHRIAPSACRGST